MPKLRPLGDRLLVTPYHRDTQLNGSILLPEKQRDVIAGLDRIFWVVATSEKAERDHGIKAKDRVLLNIDHDGLDLLTDGTKRGFVRASQVMAVCSSDF